MLDLAFGPAFAERYRRPGLLRLDAALQACLGRADSALRDRGRSGSGLMDTASESALILDVARVLGAPEAVLAKQRADPEVIRTWGAMSPCKSLNQSFAGCS